MIKEVFGKGFYQTRPGAPCQGRLGWSPVLYVPAKSEMRLLAPGEKGQWLIRNLDRRSFTAESHPPLTVPFPLETSEEYVCLRAKKRPVVLMSAESFKSLWSEMPHLFSFRGRLDVRACWLTVPLYSYHEPDFQALVESLYFPAFFPMPGNNGCPEHDSFARIDRVQVVHESLVEHSDYVLDETFVLPMLREAAISHWSGVTYGEIYPSTRSEFLGKLREQGVIH